MKKYSICLLIITMLLSACSGTAYRETRFYPVEEYTVHEDGTMTVKTFLEDTSERYLDFPEDKIFFYEGENKIILESSVAGGSIDDGVLGRYLYLDASVFE